MKVYNFYDTMNRIANYKLDYENSDAKGDEEGKKKAAEAAKPLYEALRSAGFSNYADDLSKSNSQQAYNLAKKAGKQNNTPFREYMYNKGQSMGLDKKKIDSMIKFDNDTGQIYFGGKNIGNPTAIVDGVSYYSDTSVLDKAFDNAMNTLGVEVPLNKQVDKYTGTLLEQQAKDIDYVRGLNDGVLKELDSNPFETEAAASIYNQYGVKGDNASRNALADGASSNSGNIDSFSQANANRWKAYYKSLADQSILDYYNTRTGKYQNNLNDYISGRNVQFKGLQDSINNTEVIDQTRKQNEFNQELEKAKLTGVQPESWQTENPFIQNGVPIEMDYQASINTLTEKLKDPTLSSEEKARINDNLWFLKDARYKKVYGDLAKYGQYVDTIELPGQRMTVQEQQRNFENDQTATDNYYKNATISSAITGNVDNGVGNQYFVNGKVKPAIPGYYTNVVKSIDKQLEDKNITAETKSALEAQRAYAYEAAVANGESLSGVTPSAPRKSYTNMNDAASRASAERISMAGIEGNKYAADKSSETSKYVADKEAEINKYTVDKTQTKPKLTLSQARAVIKDGVITQDVIDAYNYHTGGNYTVDNPPTLDGVIDSGNDTNSQENLTVYYSEKVDESKLKKHNVDENGRMMIEELNKEADKNGGVLSEDEVLEYVIANSDRCNTNLNQLKKVYDYLGLDKSKLNGLKDSGFWFWEWEKGVEKDPKKTNTDDSNK